MPNWSTKCANADGFTGRSLAAYLIQEGHVAPQRLCYQMVQRLTHRLYALSIQPGSHRLDWAKHRWIIERDYQDLKQEMGLGHFEGRHWRGVHQHAKFCLAAY